MSTVTDHLISHVITLTCDDRLEFILLYKRDCSYTTLTWMVLDLQHWRKLFVEFRMRTY